VYFIANRAAEWLHRVFFLSLALQCRSVYCCQKLEAGEGAVHITHVGMMMVMMWMGVDDLGLARRWTAVISGRFLFCAFALFCSFTRCGLLMLICADSNVM
jgi:hypothetical protein